MVPSVFRGSSRGLGQEPDVRDEAVFVSQSFQSFGANTQSGNRAAFPTFGFK